MYKVKTICNNCHLDQDTEIKKGLLICDALKDISCSHCECKTLVISTSQDNKNRTINTPKYSYWNNLSGSGKTNEDYYCLLANWDWKKHPAAFISCPCPKCSPQF